MKTWYFIIHSNLQNTSNMGFGYADSEPVSFDGDLFEEANSKAYNYGVMKYGDPHSKKATDIACNANRNTPLWYIEPVTEYFFNKRKNLNL